MPKEVEIKFLVSDIRALRTRLRELGFRLVTRRKHELNAVYDLPGHPLRRRGELLRLRNYGGHWTITHKAPGPPGRHKSRVETETTVADGRQMHLILRALGFLPTFRYEKFRSEWADAKGHVVLDETPIGNVAEIEGPARWIDETAARLGVARDVYITATYAELFRAWKHKTGSPAEDMTFASVRGSKRRTAVRT
jgi:adenylate cyclase class 2